ncbi:MAG: Peptidase-M48 domain-containing protein [Burkholderia sp.]|jgi:beta-barrel assembly-enhancing protease
MPLYDSGCIYPLVIPAILMRFRAWALLAASTLTAWLPALAGAADQGTLDLNLPSLGTAGGDELSPAQEHEIGSQIMNKLRADPSYLHDPVVTEYLNRIGYQLVSHAGGYTYQFFFFPIRDASLNAFALPGGYVAVHTGTIIAAKNESELAGVMGHEIGHVTQRHVARMLESQRGNVALSLGSILLAILAARAGGSSGGNAAAAIAMGSQAAMIQSQLNYSQDAEREADRVGLQTLYRAGFNPKGMESFFERLQANNRYYESAAPAYLSTHPLTVERISDMENRTRQLPARTHRDSLDFRLVQVRCEVLQETTPNGWMKMQKEFRRRLAKAPGDRESAILHYGLSVAAERLHQKSDAYAEAKLAMGAGKSSILTRNLTRTQFDAAKNRTEQNAAVAAAKKAMETFPLSQATTENYIDMLYAQNRHQELINFLRNGTALSTDDPDYHALLARSYEKLGKKSLQYMHTGEMYALMGATEAAVYQYSLAQKAADGDFYTMSEIDARLRELREKFRYEKAHEK